MNKNENPLVSIIVITYNSSKYVLETLESAKYQTYKNIELIISDDGSDDKTVGICKKWLGRNSNYFVITKLILSEKNTGIPANCNRGLNEAKGEWIKFIAGDDSLNKNCIIDNVNYISQNPYIKVLLSYAEIYLNTFSKENRSNLYPNSINEDFFNSNISAEEQYKLLLLSDRVHSTPSLFISRNTLNSINGFDERFKHAEDYPLWLRLTKFGYKLCFMEKITVKYRKHAFASNNFIDNLIIKPIYLKNEIVREIYVYPYINKITFLNFKYQYAIYYIITLLKVNKNNVITFFPC